MALNCSARWMVFKPSASLLFDSFSLACASLCNAFMHLRIEHFVHAYLSHTVEDVVLRSLGRRTGTHASRLMGLRLCATCLSAVRSCVVARAPIHSVAVVALLVATVVYCTEQRFAGTAAINIVAVSYSYAVGLFSLCLFLFLFLLLCCSWT